MVNLENSGMGVFKIELNCSFVTVYPNLVLEVAEISTMLVRDPSGLFPQQQYSAEVYSTAGTRASPRSDQLLKNNTNAGLSLVAADNSSGLLAQCDLDESR